MKIAKLNVHGVYSSDGYTNQLIRVYTTVFAAQRHVATGGGYYSHRPVTVFVDEDTGDVYQIKSLGMRLDETEEERKRREVLAKLSPEDRKTLGLEEP